MNIKDSGYLARTTDYISELTKPTVGIAVDVLRHYTSKIYRHLLSSRNDKRYYTFLAQKANSYEQFAAAGFMLDRVNRRDEWKNEDFSSDYDYELIKDRLNNLVCHPHNYRTSLTRNLGDMGNFGLYEKSTVGTKRLIEDYIDEVTKQLHFIADYDVAGWPIKEKIEFFRNIQIAYGRTALLLSGGGTFGLSHIGAIKALWEQKLLPKVMTGSSAGAIVAGIFCCKTDKELEFMMDPKHVNLNFFERAHEHGNPFIMLSRFIKHGCIRDVEVFNECMMSNIGDITFQEAYNRTRRILNITVSSSTSFEMPKLLNYLTAPNVVIRSAIAASSAVPFVYRSAPLMAKDANKNIVQWNPSGFEWIDGSVEGDLPMQRISELFGVNHYLVAQTNPHIIPFLNASGRPSSKFSKAVSFVANVVGSEFQHRFSQLGIHNNLLLKVHSILSQTYVGDITIVPYFSWLSFLSIMSNPDLPMAREYTKFGERATWPKIALIRNHTQIEQCISQNILSLRERLVSSDLSISTIQLSPNFQIEPQSLSAAPKMESKALKLIQDGESFFEREVSQSPDYTSPDFDDVFVAGSGPRRNNKSSVDFKQHSRMSLLRSASSSTSAKPIEPQKKFFLGLTFEDSSSDDENI